MSLRFPLIEGLRAVAALSVFVCHVIALHTDGDTLLVRISERLGPIGVSLFFVISGFVLYRPFLVARGRGERVDVGRFFKRRLARIVPAYWACLTLTAAVGAVRAVFSDRFWVFYGFLQTYTTETAGQGLGPAWTLCVEMTFYAALPLFALLMHKHGAGAARRGVRNELIVLGALAVAALAFRAFAIAVSPSLPLALSIMATFTWFAAGMMLAVVLVHARETSGARLLDRIGSRPTLCTALALCVHVLLLQWPLTTFGAPRGIAEVMLEFALFGIAAVLLLVPAVFGRHGRPVVLGNRLMLWLGQISYGIYLWHYPFLQELATVGIVNDSPYPLITYVLLLVPLTIGFAAASYYLIERPILRRVGSRAASASDDQGLRTGLAVGPG